VLAVLVPVAAAAQAGTASASAASVPPDTTFDIEFRKFLRPDNVFSPYYSWDGRLSLRLTVLRRGAGALKVTALVQTVGTENLGTRVGVGGTGYLLGVAYEQTRSSDLTVSAGIMHLSSHLTRDLDDKTDEERSRGAPIPEVGDPDEYNVVYVKAEQRMPRWPLAPVFEAILAPVDLRFRDVPLLHARPVSLNTRWTLWRSGRRTVVAETQHEIGRRSFNHFAVALELDEAGGSRQRLRIFMGGSPGGNLHVSPHIGGLRDGLSAGVRLTVRN